MSGRRCPSNSRPQCRKRRLRRSARTPLPPRGRHSLRACLDSREVTRQMQAEAAAEAPAFDLELQSAVPVGGSRKRNPGGGLAFRGPGRGFGIHYFVPGLSSELAHPSLQNSARGCPAASAPAARLLPETAPPPSRGRGSLDGPLGICSRNSAPSWANRTTEDEDLETHYNLGIAYREMGLLEEAISEFQKVASSADKGPAFRYAMQCSTLLGLAFMEKGQPAIAAIWYERALKTPGLDQESILALRYDLGVAQELAGDTHAAFNSFSQVYAMNIDYRDVSERIALLGKAR